MSVLGLRLWKRESEGRGEREGRVKGEGGESEGRGRGE